MLEEHLRRKAVNRRRVEVDLVEIVRVGFVPLGRLEVRGCSESVSEDLIPRELLVSAAAAAWVRRRRRSRPRRRGR